MGATQLGIRSSSPLCQTRYMRSNRSRVIDSIDKGALLGRGDQAASLLCKLQAFSPFQQVPKRLLILAAI